MSVSTCDVRCCSGGSRGLGCAALGSVSVRAVGWMDGITLCTCILTATAAAIIMALLLAVNQPALPQQQAPCTLLHKRQETCLLTHRRWRRRPRAPVPLAPSPQAPSHQPGRPDRRRGPPPLQPLPLERLAPAGRVRRVRDAGPGRRRAGRRGEPAGPAAVRL